MQQRMQEVVALQEAVDELLQLATGVKTDATVAAFDMTELDNTTSTIYALESYVDALRLYDANEYTLVWKLFQIPLTWVVSEKSINVNYNELRQAFHGIAFNLDGREGVDNLRGRWDLFDKDQTVLYFPECDPALLVKPVHLRNWMQYVHYIMCALALDQDEFQLKQSVSTEARELSAALAPIVNILNTTRMRAADLIKHAYTLDWETPQKCLLMLYNTHAVYTMLVNTIALAEMEYPEDRLAALVKKIQNYVDTNVFETQRFVLSKPLLNSLYKPDGYSQIYGVLNIPIPLPTMLDIYNNRFILQKSCEVFRDTYNTDTNFAAFGFLHGVNWDNLSWFQWYAQTYKVHQIMRYVVQQNNITSEDEDVAHLIEQADKVLKDIETASTSIWATPAMDFDFAFQIYVAKWWLNVINAAKQHGFDANKCRHALVPIANFLTQAAKHGNPPFPQFTLGDADIPLYTDIKTFYFNVSLTPRVADMQKPRAQRRTQRRQSTLPKGSLRPEMLNETFWSGVRARSASTVQKRAAYDWKKYVSGIWTFLPDIKTEMIDTLSHVNANKARLLARFERMQTYLQMSDKALYPMCAFKQQAAEVFNSTIDESSWITFLDSIACVTMELQRPMAVVCDDKSDACKRIWQSLLDARAGLVSNLKTFTFNVSSRSEMTPFVALLQLKHVKDAANQLAMITDAIANAAALGIEIDASNADKFMQGLQSYASAKSFNEAHMPTAWFNRTLEEVSTAMINIETQRLRAEEQEAEEQEAEEREARRLEAERREAEWREAERREAERREAERREAERLEAERREAERQTNVFKTYMITHEAKKARALEDEARARVEATLAAERAQQAEITERQRAQQAETAELERAQQAETAERERQEAATKRRINVPSTYLGPQQSPKPRIVSAPPKSENQAPAPTPIRIPTTTTPIGI
jgi:hypothetical protein